MNLIHRINLQKRKIYKWVLNLFSLSAVMFIFQCCYGTPNDLRYDVQIKGKVLSKSTSLPIPGIKVILEKYSESDYSDSDGAFTIYAPMDTIYRIQFMDVDSTVNQQFTQKDTIIGNKKSGDLLQFNIYLD